MLLAVETVATVLLVPVAALMAVKVAAETHVGRTPVKHREADPSLVAGVLPRVATLPDLPESLPNAIARLTPVIGENLSKNRHDKLE